jgi:predicted HicB family RNase H-like nuclease
MASKQDDRASVQLAVRIPRALHRRLRIHCVTHEVLITDFVLAALQEQLARLARKPTAES